MCFNSEHIKGGLRGQIDSDDDGSGMNGGGVSPKMEDVDVDVHIAA